MKTPTAQEVFDLAVGGCLRQGRRSMRADGTCAYRGLGGLKCAAGFVFTDTEVVGVDDPYLSQVSPFYGCVSARAVIFNRAERLSEHADLLSSLQRVHDANHVPTWTEEFRSTPAALDLSATVIDEWEAAQ